MGRLHDLYEFEGQSPWLDNLKRAWLESGEIQQWIDRGVRGITSNPSIFQKAMTAGSAYDEQLAALIAEGRTVADARAGNGARRRRGEPVSLTRPP